MSGAILFSETSASCSRHCWWFSDRRLPLAQNPGQRGVIVKNRENRLAIDSGVPVRTLPFAPWPQFADDEISAACAVLRCGKVNYWTGEEGLRFEEEFARYLGCRYAVAVANGTVALELALRAAGIGPGDEVVVPARTFIASASSV